MVGIMIARNPGQAVGARATFGFLATGLVLLMMCGALLVITSYSIHYTKLYEAEGADHILDWQSPNFVYQPVGTEKIKLLLKNYRLSDDIAFRFSENRITSYNVCYTKLLRM